MMTADELDSVISTTVAARTAKLRAEIDTLRSALQVAEQEKERISGLVLHEHEMRMFDSQRLQSSEAKVEELRQENARLKDACVEVVARLASDSVEHDDLRFMVETLGKAAGLPESESK